jgi:hypothetical protein
VTIVPVRGRLEIAIVPPLSSMLRLALASPSPDPAVFVEK